VVQEYGLQIQVREGINQRGNKEEQAHITAMEILVISQGKNYVARQLSLEIDHLGAVACGGF